MRLIAYARVSTSGQTLDAQLEQLAAEGCELIFKETMSGARSDRPELAKALRALEEGDTLVATRPRSVGALDLRSSGDLEPTSPTVSEPF